MPPKFIFLRHGEAEHNVGYYTEGVSAFSNELYRDAKLTAKGIEQAKQVAKDLRKFKIRDIWTSPLTRTIQTAEECFEELDFNCITMHDALLECLGGNHICNERKSQKELSEKYHYWNTDLIADAPQHYIRRESLSNVRQRVLMLVLYLNELYKSLSDEYHILLVTHKDVIYSITGKEMKNCEYVITTLDEILK